MKNCKQKLQNYKGKLKLLVFNLENIYLCNLTVAALMIFLKLIPVLIDSSVTSLSYIN